MKKVVFAFLTILLVLSGCGGSAPEATTTGETKEFTIIARNWEWEPSVIEVNRGDTVLLHVVGEDDGTGAGHGIAFGSFGVHKVVRGGETVDIEFVADKSGTFPFVCSVFCGRGHADMKGTLIVN